jgi:D-alanine-D-alanine ligase
MKVAFTHNLRLTDVRADREGSRVRQRGDGERDRSRDRGRRPRGREGRGLGNRRPTCSSVSRPSIPTSSSTPPRATTIRGRLREALYPALFEELGIPYTGSDAYTNALTLDKWLTKLLVGRAGDRHAARPAGQPPQLRAVVERGAGLAFPVIVKPNHEGSEQGHLQRRIRASACSDGSVIKEPRDLPSTLKTALRPYPDGVLIEEYIEGIDVAIGYIDGVGHDATAC